MMIFKTRRHFNLCVIFMAILLMTCFFFSSTVYAGYADECTEVLPPDTGGKPLEIRSGEVKCLGEGTYVYSYVNIYGEFDKDGMPVVGKEGKLIFKDAKIDFWAKSILVENGGNLIIGSPDEPVKNKITIHLYGDGKEQGITCKTTRPSDSSAPSFVCGVPKDKWQDGGSDEYLLPGGKSDTFYAYKKTDFQYVAGGEEGSYFGRKVLALSYGGTIRMFGAKGATYGDFDPEKAGAGKSWARLNATIDKPEIKLRLDRVVDWQETDKVVVTTTDYLPGHSEELTIGTIASDKTHSDIFVEEKEGVAFRHVGQTYSMDKHGIPPRLTEKGFKIKEVETRAAVALLSRNIRIVSEDCADYSADQCLGMKEEQGNYFGGHTVVRQGFKQYQVQGVEFHQLGQGGRAARMPVNFFLTRVAPEQTFVRDCSINESMTHWIELRGAQNVYLERNVGYKSIGHGFVLADGTEINNTLRGNIGILARASVKNRQNPRAVPGILSDLGSKDDMLQNAGDAVHPSIFFIGNGYNDFTYNMAAGAATCGACYWIAQAKGDLSGNQYDAASYAGIQQPGGPSAPVKSFRGNFCSTAMHSLITIGSVGACDGVKNDAVFETISDTKLRALNNKAFVTISRGPINANLTKTDCSKVQRDCENDQCSPLNDAYVECLGKNVGHEEKCETEKNQYTKCTQDCGKKLQACNAVCDKGNTYNCAVTVIEDYTSSYHWASTNVSAVWLRTNWFLVTDSVLTDVLNGGLTMVSGGTYDQVINGYWALTRKSAFIGHTQEGNPYATNAGPVVGSGSSLKCENKTGFCALIDEGVSYPTENFSVYQRLYNIYDGPVYQETNAFLNIKETLIDCNAGGKPDKEGRCNSPYMFGSGKRGVGIPRAKDKINEGKCILPNAAIGWKQPNGFYYPPAFYSQNLYFNDVDLRHFIIIPLFDAGTYTVNEAKLKEQYCTYNPDKPIDLFSESWTDIDRQTELNDIDGTLSGLANTISVNNDEFFSVPMQPDECLSEKTCFQVPYDYITAVAFPDEAAGQSKPVDLGNSVWMQHCDNQACRGVPIYRQLLKGGNPEEKVGPAQMARMMGGGISQRSLMIYNNGVYYIDTSIADSNLFEAGKKYDFFLIYAKDTSRVTFQIYVGDGFKYESDPKGLDIKLIRVNTKKQEIPGVNPKYDPGKYRGGIDAVTSEDWPAAWTKDYKNGILTVTMDMTGSLFKQDFEDSREENCRPPSFCKWDGEKKQCKYNDAADSRNPSPYKGPDGNDICAWAVKAPECPSGGCYGFQIKMPSGFDRKNAIGKRPAPQKYADRSKDWCLDWEKLKWQTPAGEKAQQACDYINNKELKLPACD
ncbi:MAG: G8 domain-containing protein [Syntrophaceae bacterium]|nr:G8 domain-containing protein [Syntrophaceae bacterium]